jgi:DNA-binding Xre family transcriptional regulator
VSGPEFEWRLRELMAMRGMFATSDLIGPLADRGIRLSRSQVYRLVADPPERISLSMLLALVDILDCQLPELATPRSAGQAGSAGSQAG